jgi:TRAP-type C4-dicarboxylate transport system substrate-binding protein
MSGQLALATSEHVVAAATWETLPPEVQRAIALALARLAARLIEAERDE